MIVKLKLVQLIFLVVNVHILGTRLVHSMLIRVTVSRFILFVERTIKKHVDEDKPKSLLTRQSRKPIDQDNQEC